MSPHQEIRSSASALPSAPPLHRRTRPSVHPSATVARASAAMSALPEPPQWTGGHLPRPPRVQTRRVPWWQAPLQRPHRAAAASPPAVAAAWDAGRLAVGSGLFVPAHRQTAGPPDPAPLPLGLVAAPGGPVLRDGAPRGGPGRRGCPRPHRWPEGASQARGAEVTGALRAWAPPAACAWAGP